MMQYPELVDYCRLDKLLDEKNHPQTSSIDVLDVSNDKNLQWRADLDDDALADLLSVGAAVTLRVLSVP
jgi:hypothetical protein